MTRIFNSWCWQLGLAVALAICGGIASGASSLAQVKPDVKLAAESSEIELLVAQAAPTPPPPPPPLTPTSVPTTPPPPAIDESTKPTQSTKKPRKPASAASTPPAK